MCRAVGARVAPTGGLLSAMVRGDLRAFVHNVVMRRGGKRMMRAFRRYTVLLAWVVLVGVATGCGAIVLHWVLGVIEVVAFGHDETLHPIITYYSSTPRRVVALVVVGFVLLLPGMCCSLGGGVAGRWLRWSLWCGRGRWLSAARGLCGRVFMRWCRLWRWVRARRWVRRLPRVSWVRCLRGVLRIGGTCRRGRGARWWLLRRRLVWRRIIRFRLRVWCFLFEALGLGLSVKNVLVGAFTVGVATATAHLTISDQATYPVVLVQTCWESLALAVLLGVVLAPGALWFRRLLGWAQRGRVTNRSVLWRVPLVFAVVGVVSMVLPEVMGNGRALVQQTFNRAELVGSFTVPALLYTLGLFVAKAVLVVAALRHGSYGGTLTRGWRWAPRAGLWWLGRWCVFARGFRGFRWG